MGQAPLYWAIFKHIGIRFQDSKSQVMMRLLDRPLTSGIICCFPSEHKLNLEVGNTGSKKNGARKEGISDLEDLEGNWRYVVS